MHKEWLKVIEQSMSRSSMPFALMDNTDFSFLYSTPKFEQLLWAQSMRSGMSLQECLEQLRPAAEECVASLSEQIHVWKPTNLRIVLSPMVQDDQVLGINCMMQPGEQVESEYLQEALNGLPVGIWMATAEGRFNWVNRASPVFQSGVNIEEYLDSGIWLDRIHSDDQQMCASFFTQTVLNGCVAPSEIRVRVQDGSFHWFVIDGGPVHNPSGNISGWAGVALDVQRFKDELDRKDQQIAGLEQELASQRQRLDSLNADLSRMQKMDLLGQLAGNVAHDFNNLLFVIRLNTNMLIKASPDPKVAEIAQMILRDVGRAARTATELMTFSGRQPQLPQNYAVRCLLLDIERLLQRAVGDERELRLELSEDLSAVNVDKTYFENALMNLVINARDAIAGQGQIVVKAHNVCLQQDGLWKDFVEITVSDTGSGMSPEIQSRVLEPFFTTKELGQGAGLGLPMVARFVEQAKGQLNIHSEPGRGTTIRILLPTFELLAPAPEIEPEPLPAISAGQEHIFLVEDDLHVRNAVARLLIDQGYVVTPASTPEMALELLRRGLKPDLMLSDIRMPGRLSVVDMVEHMDAEGLQCPILFMTGYSSDVSLLSERFHVLQKPVPEEVLLAKIHQILQECPQNSTP